MNNSNIIYNVENIVLLLYLKIFFTLTESKQIFYFTYSATVCRIILLYISYTGCSITRGSNFDSLYKNPKITLFQEYRNVHKCFVIEISNHLIFKDSREISYFLNFEDPLIMAINQ